MFDRVFTQPRPEAAECLLVPNVRFAHRGGGKPTVSNRPQTLRSTMREVCADLSRPTDAAKRFPTRDERADKRQEEGLAEASDRRFGV